MDISGFLINPVFYLTNADISNFHLFQNNIFLSASLTGEHLQGTCKTGEGYASTNGVLQSEPPYLQQSLGRCSDKDSSSFFFLFFFHFGKVNGKNCKGKNHGKVELWPWVSLHSHAPRESSAHRNQSVAFYVLGSQQVQRAALFFLLSLFGWWAQIPA